ncbi:MAG: cytochrome c-type biogenesis protein CcmH [Paracoccaceae bacterium]|nr:cytochrome c-type biogenesis protein CcmH [Paracoccaceae bacterium]
MRALLLALALLLAAPAGAVEPDEVLADPALEARARALSKEVRCLVCRNESIDDSNAELARDLRLLIRERLEVGDSDPQVLDFLVARYGEFVLLRPRFSTANAALWFAGPAVFLIGLVLVLAYLRRQHPKGRAETALSQDERARLDKILKD